MIQILQQTVPAMDPDAKIIVVETVVLPPGQYGFLEERWARYESCLDILPFSHWYLTDYGFSETWISSCSAC